MTIKPIALLLLLAGPSLAYYSFRNKIPNGEVVPHPCKPNYMWQGVGHLNEAGGGDRNPFGIHFEEAGRKWSRDLCLLDSDGDGKTNGEELGDPNCVWEEGTVPEVVDGISHPGVCEPYGQGICEGRDSFVDCNIMDFGDSCSVIKDLDVKTMDLTFTNHTIPPTETNYMCQFFHFPTDRDYHIVANEALIDNQKIVHHIVLYGCPETYRSKPTDDRPSACAMVTSPTSSCYNPIVLWAIGIPGTCFGEEIGFKVGATGYKIAKLEIHYNNPGLVPNYSDASGVRLFYREKQAHMQDLATFNVGQILLEIPPGQPRVDQTGSCPTECTSYRLRKPIYVVGAFHHMHYMGRAQKTVVIRDGKVIKTLAHDPHYSYDNPVLHRDDKPFEILPGDEVKTTCTFSSMSKKSWVFFGDAIYDEMCLSFIIVYPADALLANWCTDFGPLSSCDRVDGSPRQGCDWRRFSNISNPEMFMWYMQVEKKCSLDGRCRPECKALVEEIMQHACMQGQMRTVVTSFMMTYLEGARFLGRLQSCSGYLDTDKDMYCEGHCEDKCPVVPSDGDAATLPVIQVATLLVSAFTSMAAFNLVL